MAKIVAVNPVALSITSGVNSSNTTSNSSSLGSLASKRKIRTKKWAQVYTEKIARDDGEENEFKRSMAREEVKDWLSGIWARTMISKRLSKIIKQKIRMKSHSCKKSLLNIQYPTQVSEWNKDWGSQLMCNICNTPAIYDAIVCNTCDCIAHIACIEQSMGYGTRRNPSSNGEEDEDSHLASSTPKASTLPVNHILIRKDETDEEAATIEYYCNECNQHEQLEKLYYNKELTRLKHERYLKQMVNRITSTIKTRIQRIRFLKQRQLTIVLQSLARRHFIRRKFHQLRRNQIRIVLVDIVNLPKIEGACLIVWTVVDKFKNHQLFRLDKEINRAMNEGFLIPGTSANVSIYLTIIKSEGQNLFMVGQCQLALRDVNPFEENQIHTLTVSENIEWTPQETRVEKLVFQTQITNHNSSTYIPAEHPDAATQSVSNPHTADPSQSLNSRHETILHSSPSLSSHHSSTSAIRQTAQIRYTALNSVTSYCAHIHGPPLDVLRRTADHYFHNPRNKNNVAERKTRWWLCVVELNLLFYQYFGDTKPRFTIYIGDVIANIPRDVVNNSSAMIIFPDKRKWLFDFDTPYETKRFVYTINESKKAMEGTSIFFKHQKQFTPKFLN